MFITILCIAAPGVYAVFMDSKREKQINVIAFVRWGNFRTSVVLSGLNFKAINRFFETLSKVKLGCAGASVLAILFRIIGLSLYRLPFSIMAQRVSVSSFRGNRKF